MVLRIGRIYFSIMLFVFALLFFNSQVSSQSRMPADTSNWLQNSDDPALGDVDAVNVIFFEIPDTVTSTIYFGIYDAGTDNLVEDDNTGPTEFYLVGGSGALSSPNSQLVDYSADTSVARTGTLLSSFTADNGDANHNDNWFYFPQGVSPSQGEHIGNKYYFKVVVDMSGTALSLKNAYQLDVSYTGTNGSSPSAISGAASFAYNLCFDLANGYPAWNLYPYVPESALASDYIIFHNFDFDGAGTFDIRSLSNYDVTPEPTPSASGVLSSQDYLISTVETASTVNERNGTWTYNFISTSGSIQNASEIWVTIDNENGAPLDDGTPLRMYSYPQTSPNAADHVVLASEDGTAIANGSDTELVTLQIVDSNGDPANYSRDIYIDISDSDGTNPAQIVTVNGVAYGPSATALITTDDWGLGYFEIQRSDNGDADSDDIFTITSTAYWDGTGTSDTFGTSSSDVINVIFTENPDPTISSASNQSFAVGDGATAIPLITIDHQSVATGLKITNNGAGLNELQVRIPSGLDAIFNTAVTAPTFGGTASAKVNGTVSYSGDSKTLLIEVTSDFATGDTLTINGLQMQTFGSASSGSLELSWDSGSTFPGSDDKTYSITDPNLDFIWTGATDSNWGTATNWSPNGVPGTGQNVLIPSASNYPILVGARTVDELTISSGGILDLSGQTLTTNVSFENAGTLKLVGTETVSGFPWDSDSGTAEYTGAGTPVLGTTYNNLIISGTLTLGASIDVNSDLTVTGTLNQGGAYDINVAGDAVFTGGAFTKNTGGTLIFDGGASQTLTPAGLDLGNLQTSTAGTSLSIAAAGDFDDISVDASTTITAGGAVYVGGSWSNAGSFITGTNTVTFDGTGTHTIATGGTADNQDFENLTFNGTGDFTVSSALDVDGTLAVTNAGSVAFSGDTTVATGMTATGANADISFTGAANSIAGTTTFSNTGGSLTLGNLNTDSIAFTGGLTASAAVVTGGINTAGTIQTTNSAISLGDVTLTADTSFIAGTGTIGFNSVTDGAGSFALSLQSGSTGAVTVSGGITIATLTTFATAYDMNLLGTGTIDNAVTFNNTGTLTLGDDNADSFTFTGGLTATAPPTINLAGSISSTDTAIVLDPATVTAGASSISTNGGTLTLDDLDGGVALTIQTTGGTGTGAITFNGILGGVTPFTGLTVTSKAALALPETHVSGNLGATTAAGAITDTANLTITGSVTMSANAGGSAITLDDNGDATYQSTFGQLNLTGSTVTVYENDVMDLGDITAAILIVQSETGGITDTGTAVSVSTNGSYTSVTANDTIVLDTLAGAGTVALTTTGATGNASISHTGAVDLAASTVNGDLTVSSSGDITDSGTLDVTGTVTLTTSLPFVHSITLDDNGDATYQNTLGSIVITGCADASIYEADPIDIGASIINGNLILNSVAAGAGTGAVTQSGAITITGDFTVTTNTSDVTLNNNANDFDDGTSGSIVSVLGASNDVVLHDANSIVLGTINANSLVVNAARSAPGDITQSTGPLTITTTADFDLATSSGDINISTQANNIGGIITVGSFPNVVNLSIRNDNATAAVPVLPATGMTNLLLNFSAAAITLPAINISGTLDVTAGGLVSDSGVLSIGSTTTIAAGAANNITLNNANDFTGDVLITSGNNVTLVDTNSIGLGTSTVSGTLDVTANAIVINDVVSANAADLDASGGAGNITDAAGTGELTVATTTILAAVSATDNIVLDTATNDFGGDVSIASALNVTLVDANNISFGASTVSGNLNVTSGLALTNDITDTGNLAVTGMVTMNAGLADITLDDNGDVTYQNSFGQLNLTGANVTVYESDAAGMDLGTISATTLSVQEETGSITDSGTVTVSSAGFYTTSAAGADITLGTLAGAGTVALSTTAANGDASVTHSGQITLAASTVNGALSLTSGGGADILDSAVSTITGTTTLTAGTGTVTLDNGSDFQGAVSIVSSGAATLVDANAITLGASSVTNLLDVTADSMDITGAVSAGSLDFDASGGAGNITDTGGSLTITTTALFTAAGDTILLDNAANDFQGAVTVANPLGTTSISDTDGILLGAITTGTLTIDAANGSAGTITQSGVTIITSGASTFDVGTGLSDILLVNDNDISGLITVGTNGAVRDLTIRNVNATAAVPALPMGLRNLTLQFTTADITILPIALTGALDVLSGGNISQSGAISVALTTTLSSSGSTTLSTSTNDFTGTVTVTTSTAASLADANSISLAAITTTAGLFEVDADAIVVTGTVTVNSLDFDATYGAGTITDTTGQFTVTNAAVFNANGTDNIILDAAGNDFQGNVTVTNGQIVTITDTNALTILSATSTGDLTINAGGVTSLTSATTSGAGDVYITTTAGNIAIASLTAAGFSVNLTPAAAVTELSPDAGADIVCADLIVVSATGFGSADALETTVNTVDIQNATSGAIALTDTDAVEVIRANQATAGDVNIAADGSITVSTNGITAAGAGNVNLDATTAAGSDIILTAAVNSGTGTLTLDADDLVNLQADLTSSGGTVSVTGTNIAINAAGVDITTGGAVAGDIVVTGPVDSTTTRPLTLTAGTGSITFNNAVGGSNRLGLVTVNSAADVNFQALTATAFTQTAGSGTSTFAGVINLNTAAGFDLTGTNVDIQNSVTTTTNGIFTVAHTGTMTIQAAGDMVLDGAFSQTGAGTVQTAGDITTTADNISFNSTVELTGNAAMSTGAAGGNISFSSDVFSSTAGTETLDLTGGTGNILFNSTVGLGTRLGALTVQSAGNLSFTGAVTGSSIQQVAGTGTTTFTNTVNLNNAAGLDLNGTAFTFSNTVTTTGTGPIAITNSGLVTTAAAADFSLDGAFTIDGNGPVNLGGDITTTADDIIFDGTGTVIVADNGAGNDVSLDSTGGNIRFDGDLGGAGLISIDSGAGTLDFTSTVGAGTPLSGLIVPSSTGLTFAGTVEVDDENLNLTGTVMTFQNTLTTTNAGTVTIANSGNLIIQAGAVFNLDGLLAQTGAGNVYCDADITTSNDNIGINGPFYMDQNITLSTGGAGVGNITFNSTIDGNTVARNLILTAGTGNVTLSGAVGTSQNLNNLTVTAADISIDSVGDGTGNGLDGALTLTSTGNTTLTGGDYRSAGNQDFNTAGASFWNHTSNGRFQSGGTITFDDVYLDFNGFTVSLFTDINTGRFVFYRGTLDMNGQTLATTENGGQDLVVFGAAFDNDDADWSGADTRFEYPDFATINAVYARPGNTAAFSAGVAGSTITVGANFYVNGTDLNNLNAWNLNVNDVSTSFPQYNDGTSAIMDWGTVYNVAFNLTVANCTVTGGNIAAAIVAAPEANNGITAVSDTGDTNSEYVPASTTGWDFVRPYITDIDTVWDNTLRIEFSEPIENSNNEIQDALTNATISMTTDNGGIVMATSYVSIDLTTGAPGASTTGAGDLDTIYVVTQNATDTWNTDADGGSAGVTGTSSDATGTTQATIPDLTLFKSMLFSAGGHNPVRDYGTQGIQARYTSTDDECPPLVVAVATDNHGVTGDAYDNHNYMTIRFSEPVGFYDDGAGVLVDEATTIPADTAGNTYAFNGTDYLGDIPNVIGAAVTITGILDYDGVDWTGGSTTHGFFSGSNGLAQVNTLERTSVWELQINIAAYSPDGGTNWDGYLGQVGMNLTQPATFTGLVSSNIKDANGNDAAVNTGTINTAHASIGWTGGTGWDVEPPLIGPYKSSTTFEIIPEDEDSNTFLDRFEFHVLDNASDAVTWNSDTDHPDGLGGGFRDTSLLDINSFEFEALGVEPADLSALSPSFDTSVLNSVFSLTGINVVNDPYFSIDVNPSNTSWDTLTKIWVDYDEDVGYLTDLAGNRLRTFTKERAVEIVPPNISLTLAVPGNSWGYVKFSEVVYGNDSASAPIAASDFSLTGISGLSITSVENWPGGTSGQEFLFRFSDALDENGILKAKINILPLSVYDEDGNYARSQLVYRVSDLGFNIVDPIWASDGIHDEDIREGTSLTDFDGTGKLMDRDILLQARINATAFQNLSMSMYFDANPSSDVVKNNLWLPFYHEELAPVGNYDARYVNPSSVLGNGLQEFTISSSDEDMETGNDMEFYFVLNGLPCVALDDPDDIFSFHPWSFQIQDIRKQRGGVTILNNIINPNDGDEAVLIYDLDDPGIVTVQVFALNGNMVKVLQRGRQAAGTYQYLWDGRNSSGDIVARGVYFIRVVGPEVDEIRKVMVVK